MAHILLTDRMHRAYLVLPTCPLAMILLQLLRAYLILIIIRALMSWFKPDPTAPLVRILAWITEPALSPIRRIIPPFSIPKTSIRIDLAPFFVLLIGAWILTKLKF